MTSNQADAANPMLLVVQQWSGWLRGAPAPNRWRAWSENRSNRRTRNEERRRHGGLAFLRAGHAASIHLRTTRQSIAPQLHLTLRPVFLTPGNRQSGSPVSDATQRMSAIPEPRRFTVLARASTQPEMQPRNRIDITPVHRIVNPESKVISIERTRRRDIELETRRFTEVVERVVRSHQRIETPVRGTTVIRERLNVASEVERALTNTSQRVIPAQAEPTGSPWPAENGFGMPNSSELERLTDQIVTRIDDRLTAHRERMGKAF